MTKRPVSFNNFYLSKFQENMSKKDKSAKPKNQEKLGKSQKKELKKEKHNLKNLEKDIKKRIKAIGKLNKELKKEEKDLNKLQEKKEALLVAYKLLNLTQEENIEEKEVQEPERATKTQTNNVDKKSPVRKRAVRKTSNAAPKENEEPSQA